MSSQLTWLPTESHTKGSNVAALMRALSLDSYDDLLKTAISEPFKYWQTISTYCGYQWTREPTAYIDTSRGPEFPQWFPGGRLNWIQTIIAQCRQENAATRKAIINVSEQGVDKAITYSELGERIASFAAGLRSMGTRKGDRIAILMENCIEANVAFLAIVYMGAIAVPLFSGYASEAIRTRIDGCGARFLIATTGFTRRGRLIDVFETVQNLRSTLSSLELVIWHSQRDDLQLPEGDLDWGRVCTADATTPPVEIMDPNDPFMIIYTSGTTGKPKGIVHIHGGFPLRILHDATVHFEINQNDVFCWPADIGWIAGPIVSCSALMRGATLLLYSGAPDYPNWERMPSLVEKYKVTHYGASPTLIRGLIQNETSVFSHERSSLKLLITAGEVCDTKSFLWFWRKFGDGRQPVINYTGGTEVSGGLLSSVVVRPIAVGEFNSTVPGVDVDVVDHSGKSVIDVPGELVIRGPFVGMTQSFWKDDERYLDTYWRTIEGLWVHGDLAIHKSTGAFVLLGRSDDTMKLAGKRVGPGEIEETALTVKGVQEVSAIGVPDALKGSALVLFVVRSANALPVDDLKLKKNINRQLAKGLGAIFRAREIYVVDAMPKTKSGKIMRRILRAVHEGHELGNIAGLDDPRVVDSLRGAMNAQHGTP